MAEQMTGVVEEVVAGKKLKIGGRTYSAFDGAAAGIPAINVGDSVSFQYVEKAGTGKFAGITFKNIQGKVTKMTAPAAGSAPSNTKAMPPSDRERAIIRQNALTNAVNYFNNINKTTGDDDIDAIIQIAMGFEEYTSGDLLKKVQAEVKAEIDEAFDVTDI